MWTIAKLSFKEILYKRIFLIALIMTAAYLLLYGIATHYAGASISETSNQMDSAQQAAMGFEMQMIGQQLLDMGLYFANFIIGLLSILATVGSIAGNIESHQIDPVLTRPIRRLDYLLGRYLGYGIILVLYALLFYLFIILVNQLFGGPLQVTLTAAGIIKAGLIFILIPLIIISPALFFSANLSTINSGIVLIVLYGMSFIGGFVEQLGNILHNIALSNIGIFSSLLFPVDAMFRFMVYLLSGSSDSAFGFASFFYGTTPPSGVMLFYCAAYVIVILLFGIRGFNHRDI